MSQEEHKDWLTFKSSVANLTGPRHHKINNSIGVYDIYKIIRKNKWYNIGQKLTEHQFYSIIRKINNYLADELVKGNDIKLPHKLGRLEIRKNPTNIVYDGKKVKAYLPIDWDRTLKLWYEDEEAYKNKILVKINAKELFKVYYNRIKAEYNNKGFYTFNVNRDIKGRLKNNIKEKTIDAYEMGGTIF